MFRVSLLIRAIPSILYELGDLVWFSYRTGDRKTAATATLWLVSTLFLIGFAIDAIISVIQGKSVELTSLFLVASLPISMWIAREVIIAVLTVVGRIIALSGSDSSAEFHPKSASKV